MWTAGCAQLGRESTRGSAGGQRKELSHHVERRLRGGCTKGATACLTDERALERKTRADPWVGPRSTQSGQLTSGSRTVMVPSLTASAMLSCSFGHPSFNADDCPEAIASLKVWQRSAGSEVH